MNFMGLIWVWVHEEYFSRKSSCEPDYARLLATRCSCCGSDTSGSVVLNPYRQQRSCLLAAGLNPGCHGAFSSRWIPSFCFGKCEVSNVSDLLLIWSSQAEHAKPSSRPHYFHSSRRSERVKSAVQTMEWKTESAEVHYLGDTAQPELRGPLFWKELSFYDGDWLKDALFWKGSGQVFRFSSPCRVAGTFSFIIVFSSINKGGWGGGPSANVLTGKAPSVTLQQPRQLTQQEKTADVSVQQELGVTFGV